MREMSHPPSPRPACGTREGGYIRESSRFTKARGFERRGLARASEGQAHKCAHDARGRPLAFAFALDHIARADGAGAALLGVRGSLNVQVCSARGLRLWHLRLVSFFGRENRLDNIQRGNYHLIMSLDSADSVIFNYGRA